MRNRKAYFTGGLILSAITGSAEGAELIAGRCHMDYCSWFSIESRDITATSPKGALARVESRWWQSHHPNGYNNINRARRTGGNLATGYVYCSKMVPTLIDRYEGQWVATTIAPGNPDAIHGATISSYIFYFAVCHGVTVTEANLYDQTVLLGKKFGYAAKLNDDDAQRKIDSPTDVLTR
jgi:hypothetical protein